MTTLGSKFEDGGWPARSVLECVGKRGATRLPNASRREEKRRRRYALPAQPKTWRSLVASLVFLAAALAVHAQSYSIDWHTIDAGGGTSASGAYSISGTIGQPDAGGPMTGGTFSLTGGFWTLPSVIQTPGAPALSVVPGLGGFAIISWSPATPGFVLQMSDNLTSPNWSDAPGGATNPATVPAALPSKFYRLRKP